MYVDSLTLLWDSATLGASAVSTNTYDAAATTNGLGVGEPLIGVIVVEVAAEIDSGNETYTFRVIQSANANLSSADSLVEMPFTNAQAAAELTAGAKIPINIPMNRISKRYLGLDVVIAGTIATGVTVSAWFAPASFAEILKQYPSGFTVS